MISNRIADKIIKVLANSPQKSSVTVKNKTEHAEHEKKIPKKKYIYIYLQNKRKKLLMILEYSNSIIIEYQKRKICQRIHQISQLNLGQ